MFLCYVFLVLVHMCIGTTRICFYVQFQWCLWVWSVCMQQWIVSFKPSIEHWASHPGPSQLFNIGSWNGDGPGYEAMEHHEHHISSKHLAQKVIIMLYVHVHVRRCGIDCGLKIGDLCDCDRLTDTCPTGGTNNLQCSGESPACTCVCVYVYKLFLLSYPAVRKGLHVQCTRICSSID